jgi:predicted amidohydrolase
MKVAAIQHDIAWEDPVANRKMLIEPIAQAAAGGARLIVLSEMFATGFSMHPERIAEPEGGRNEQFLIDRAREHDCWIVGSIAQWTGGENAPRPGGETVPDTAPKAANVAVLAGPDGTVTRYAKIHPFSYAGEHLRYEAGTQLCTVRIDGLRVSLFVCYDLRFADEFWAVGPDTDLFVVVANWPAARREHWRTLLRARAIENQAYLVGVNRVGAAKDLDHVGDSAIIDPLGRTLAEASYGPAILTAVVDADEVARIRQELPFLRDRRPALDTSS